MKWPALHLSAPHAHPTRLKFRERYGPWALVAGGSHGLGAEYARQLARRGLDLVLVAEAAEPLGTLGRELSAQVQVRTVVSDLSRPDMLQSILDASSDLELGLLVCNASHAPIGAFLSRTLEDKLKVVAVNCAAPVALIHHVAPGMVARGRGGIVIMSSLAGLQGSALVATYAASKAFDLVLGESLWEELSHHGVDVLALCAGATRTESYEASRPHTSQWIPPLMEPAQVVQQALDQLSRGPSQVAGGWNRLIASLLHQLPRRMAVRIMGQSMHKLYGERYY